MKKFIERFWDSLSEEDRRRLEWAGKADRFIGLVLLASGAAFLAARGISDRVGLVLVALSLLCFWRDWLRLLTKR